MRWIGALSHFSTMFGYIWRSVSTAGGTHSSWEWTSNLPLATDNYLSWDSNPSREGPVVSKRYALTTQPRRSLEVNREVTIDWDHINNMIKIDNNIFCSNWECQFDQIIFANVRMRTIYSLGQVYRNKTQAQTEFASQV